MNKKGSERKKARSGKVNRFYNGGTYSFLMELDDIDPAMNDDEATLESTGGEYKKTVKVGREGTKVDDKYMLLMFAGVIPGKRYTLTYDLNQDVEGNDLGEFTLFYDMPIEREDLDNTDPVVRNSEREPDDDDDIPTFDVEEVDEEAAALYEEPDPEADEDAILESEESRVDDEKEDVERWDDFDEEER